MDAQEIKMYGQHYEQNQLPNRSHHSSELNQYGNMAAKNNQRFSEINDDEDIGSEQLDEVDQEQFKQKKLSAKDKMKELAKKIYDSTPRIQDQFPKKQSKILADIEHDDEIAPKRIKRFLYKCEEIDRLRQQRED